MSLILAIATFSNMSLIPSQTNLLPYWFFPWNTPSCFQTPINRADQLSRMVLVPAGQNRVIFTYNPTSFNLGLKISLSGLIITLCLIISPHLLKVKKFN